MPIYKNIKIINIGIPKTCCTSIYTALKDKNNNSNNDLKKIKLENYTKRLGHLTLSQFINYYPEINIRNYNIITVIRNPYDRIYSIYNHIKKRNNTKGVPNELKTTNLNFNSWINSIKNIISQNGKLNLEKIKYLNKEDYVSFFTSQYEFLTVDNKIPSYINIFRYENITKLEKYLNLKLPILNKSNSKINYKNEYNQNSLDFIYKIYEIDFLKFGYSKQLSNYII